VPIADFKNPEHLRQLEEWMKSYSSPRLIVRTERKERAASGITYERFIRVEILRIA
jgi:hypothetical protein